MAVDETFEGVTSVSSEAGDAGSQVGTREPIEGSTFMVARKGRETGGILAFGPFVRLQRGRYEAEFELVMETDRPAAPARLRAAEYDGEVLADVPVAFQTGSRRTTEVISFERRGWLEVGLQVVYEGQGTLGVKKMSARLVEPLPEPSPEDDAWKAGLWCVGLTAVSIAWRRRGTCPRPRA
jgi:hypothetical protein